MFSIFFKQALVWRRKRIQLVWNFPLDYFLNVKVSRSIQVAVEVVCEKVFLIGLTAVELAQRVFKYGRQKKIFQRQFFK